ncbi:MAG: Hint domain-containing protein [Pseudomonadota bacterium]
MRLADIAALHTDGTITARQCKIPNLPVFDQAFAAFAQGTLFQSEHGLIAVEDLYPGDRLLTPDGHAAQITWIASSSHSGSDRSAKQSLTRVMADSFGMNRPQSFVTLGPAARLLQTPHNLRAELRGTQMMTPVSQFVDGVQVISVMPPTPVRLFHIGMRHHCALLAGGLEVESFHPGLESLPYMSDTLRNVYMSLFPHIAALSEFGPMRFMRAPDRDKQTAA